MRITSNGQVTIPQEIREHLNLLPGTEVEFEIDGNAVKIRKTTGTRSRGHVVVDRLPGRTQGPLTTDEIMRLTRG